MIDLCRTLWAPHTSYTLKTCTHPAAAASAGAWLRPRAARPAVPAGGGRGALPGLQRRGVSYCVYVCAESCSDCVCLRRVAACWRGQRCTPRTTTERCVCMCVWGEGMLAFATSSVLPSAPCVKCRACLQRAHAVNRSTAPSLQVLRSLTAPNVSANLARLPPGGLRKRPRFFAGGCECVRCAGRCLLFGCCHHRCSR